MRAFLMTRDDPDLHGGAVVAEGAIFSDGRVAIHWLISGMPSSSVIWDSIRDAMIVHNQHGDTHLAIAADIAWPPGHTYEHDHRWEAISKNRPVEGPWFCTDCGTYADRKPDPELAEVGADA